MDSAAKIQTLQRALRRKYAADLLGLRTLWGQVFNASTEFVMINGNAYEGGSATGVVLFEPLEYLAAVEALLTELDPTGTPPAPPSGALADFRCTWLQT